MSFFSNWLKSKTQKEKKEDENIEPITSRRYSLSRSGKMKQKQVSRQSVTDEDFYAEPETKKCAGKDANKSERESEDNLNIDDVIDDMLKSAKTVQQNDNFSS